VLARCVPVALTITTCWLGIPAEASVSRMGGRRSWLGAGRVMSLMTMATLSEG
jgi:hypothetical protein